MSLARYYPMSIFDQWNKEFAVLFPSFPGAVGNHAEPSHWAPSVDIREGEEQFELVADIPGIKPEDVEVTVDRNVLAIKGERRYGHSDSQKGYQRMERASGAFYRRFTLPDSIDADRVAARGEHGVLTITLPKKAKAQPESKRIPITV